MSEPTYRRYPPRIPDGLILAVVILAVVVIGLWFVGRL